MEVLLTSRLLLRPFEAGDLEDLFAYAADSAVGPNAGWPPHRGLEDSRAILERFIHEESDEVWALCLRETGRVVGSMGLHPDRLRAPGVRALGYVLARGLWGRGLVPEAAEAALAYGFDRLHLPMVSAYVFSDNVRSRRVVEKIGFRYEGTLRHATLRYDGAVLDDRCYSITSHEFRNRKEKGYENL
jgi:ribosomal-protein-alanine N-acetyltransferase